MTPSKRRLRKLGLLTREKSSMVLYNFSHEDDGFYRAYNRENEHNRAIMLKKPIAQMVALAFRLVAA